LRHITASLVVSPSAQLREVYRGRRNGLPPGTVVAVRASLVDLFGQRLFAAFFTE